MTPEDIIGKPSTCPKCGAPEHDPYRCPVCSKMVGVPRGEGHEAMNDWASTPDTMAWFEDHEEGNGIPIHIVEAHVYDGRCI